MNKQVMRVLALVVIAVLMDGCATTSSQCAMTDAQVADVKRRAELGDAAMQNQLGELYGLGRCLPMDLTQARSWFERAAEQGNSVAQYNLGFLYYHGEGVPQSDAEAARWFRMAAEGGHEHAYRMFWQIYGDGGPPPPAPQNDWESWEAEHLRSIAGREREWQLRAQQTANLAKHKQKLALSYYGSSGAAFSPDGDLLALGNRDTVWVIDTRLRQVVERIQSEHFGQFGNAKGLLFIDSQRLLIGITGGILLVDLADNSYLHKYSFSDKSYVPRAMAWSPATKTLAFSTDAMPQPVNLVEISAKGFGPTTGLPGFSHVPADLLFSDDGQFLGAAGDDSGVLIREIASGDLVGELPTEGFVNELARFGDNRLLVAGADLAFWAFYTDSEMTSMEDPDLQGQINSQVAVRVAGATALGALTALVIPIALLSGELDWIFAMSKVTADVANKPVRTAQSDWCGRSTAITRDGRLLADVYPGISKEVIRIIDVGSGMEIKKVNPPGDYSCNVAFSLDGTKLLITTSKLARIYNTGNWKYYDLKPK